MSGKEICIPDIGDFKDVAVIEVFVKEGMSLQEEDRLLSLETDKAVMDIPAPEAGTVREVSVKPGDKVSEGSLILKLEPASAPGQTPAPAQQPELPETAPSPEAPATPAKQTAPVSLTQELRIPDIGDFKDVAIVEVFIKEGGEIKKEEPLLSLETDKAVMDIPSPSTGTIRKVLVKAGDKVSRGSPVGTIETQEESSSSPAPGAEAPVSSPAPSSPKTSAPSEAKKPAAPSAAPQGGSSEYSSGDFHASPSVRKLAFTLGIDLARLKGSGPKNRITHDDVNGFLKQSVRALQSGGSSSAGGGIPSLPVIDFSRFGSTEDRPLSGIRKASGAHLHKGWLNIPLVTHFDEADITEMENFRQILNKKRARAEQHKVTPLILILKAVVRALKEYPLFNSSLSPAGDAVILKHYYHIGIAVDTPRGLTVPVIRDADKKSISELSDELRALSRKAREGALTPADMQGGSFTISSLGGIGGTGFTPLVNAPEAAIMGVARSAMKPVWNGTEFLPRLVLPFSVSYDHKIIDGAEAARFCKFLSELLTDIRYILT